MKNGVEKRVIVLEECVKNIPGAMSDTLNKVNGHESRITSLEVILKDSKDDIKNIKDSALPAISREVKDIREQLLGRPSWVVVTIITLLSSVCVGLIVYTAQINSIVH